MKKLQMERLREVLTDLSNFDNIGWQSNIVYNAKTDTIIDDRFIDPTNVQACSASTNLVTLFTENNEVNKALREELNNSLILYIKKKHAKNLNIWKDILGKRIMVISTGTEINYTALSDNSPKQLSPLMFILKYR